MKTLYVWRQVSPSQWECQTAFAYLMIVYPPRRTGTAVWTVRRMQGGVILHTGTSAHPLGQVQDLAESCMELNRAVTELLEDGRYPYRELILDRMGSFAAPLYAPPAWVNSAIEMWHANKTCTSSG